MTTWDDLNARARGLATHLLGRITLEGLARETDLPAIAAELEHRGFMIEDASRTSGAGLELAARRNIAQRFRTLTRWAGTRNDALAVLFEDEDRRSIIALLRGAMQRAPTDLRLSGLIPTRELPERGLLELASQPTPAAVAALLAAWRHPFAPALLPEAGHPEPDLLRIETALARAFAQRALRAARRVGRRGLLRRYVEQVIDLHNTFTALVLSEEKDPVLPDHWVPGGRSIALPLAQHAVATGHAPTASRILSTGFAGTRLAAVFAKPDHPAGLELAVLAAEIADLRGLTRTAPLSPAPLLSYALRLRAEAVDLRRLIWGLSLGAPTTALVEGLVTAS